MMGRGEAIRLGSSRRPRRQILTMTELGRAVLNGERDWHAQRPFPRWVGGVHIQPGVAGWRWDEARREAVFRES